MIVSCSNITTFRCNKTQAQEIRTTENSPVLHCAVLNEMKTNNQMNYELPGLSESLKQRDPAHTTLTLPLITLSVLSL